MIVVVLAVKAVRVVAAGSCRSKLVEATPRSTPHTAQEACKVPVWGALPVWAAVAVACTECKLV